ncbi:lysoplasmalogenase [Paraneptunicella aestuarii]|uniref:lysoplasmalogenase n=1 Tax=Paraneptunicella aestuarii TaxID=2831148 RepID=UPI001E47FBCE|nr:lysoplasmalogenase [Paraneptunicella aestuarii]UAA40235.1 lysoplasmalogenase [Paraneptunicella aestuarii]
MNKGIKIVLAFIIISVAYLISLDFRPYPLDFIVKATPIFLLIYYSYTELEGKLRTFTTLALLFSSFGDIFLSINIQNSFLFGLSSFLIGHIFYIAAFWGLKNKTRHMTKMLLTIVVLGMTATMGVKVIPIAGELAIPVSAYISVIASMGVFAIFAWRHSLLHFFGAFSFIISDSMIAWNKFIEPIPNERYLIMTTYYVAQLLILRGILNLQKENKALVDNTNI